MNWVLLQNSLVVAGSSALIATFCGAIFALAAASLPRFWRGVAIAGAVIALVLPPFLVTNTWLQFFGLTGTWRPFVDFNIYSLPGTILLITLSLWPVSFVVTLGSLLRIQPIYMEQEGLLRGSALCKYLLWPATRGAMAQSLGLSFVLALNNFSIPVLLQTKVYTEEVWLAFSTRFDYVTALKLSWPLVLGPLVLLAVFRAGNVSLNFRAQEFPTRLFRERLGTLFCAALVFSGFLLGISVLLPGYQLMGSARTWTEFLPAISAGRNAAFHSVLFALSAAVYLSVIGLLVRRSPWVFWSWIFFLAPGVLLGIALIYLFNRPPLTAFYQSAGIVVLAYVLRFLPLAWTSARLAKQSTDPSMREVVAAAGGNFWQQFRLGEWPQSKWFLLGGGYLLYLLCLWEVETLLLIIPPGRETLALRVFNMLHYGHAGQVDALCVWLLAFALAPLICCALVASARRFAPFTLLCALLCASGCAIETDQSAQVRSQLFSGVTVLGSRGTGAGQFNKPRSLAVDRDDNLYVVDLTGRVQKFSPSGQYLLSWQMPQTDKGKPKGMIQDSDGNIVVIEPHYSRVNHFNGEGRLLAQWGENGTNQSKLQFPRAVAINSKGEIYLSEYGLVERVQRFGFRGTNFLQAFGAPGTAEAQFNRPEGIGVGPDDRLYVADSCNHRVQVFSPDGRFITSFGRAGTAPGELSYPYDVRVDENGYRFVCEFGNSRIQVFDAQNRSVEILGGAGSEPGDLNNPWAIALDSQGNLYVADSANHRVQKFLRAEPFGLAAKSEGESEPKRLAGVR